MVKKTVDYMTFGERLAYARKKKGLKQKQFAELIGVSSDTLRHWEKGRRSPDVSTIPKIIKVLEVSEDWLMGNSDEFSMENMPKNQQDNKLTKEQQKLAADNEWYIGRVLNRLLYRKYRTKEYFEFFYGYAAVGLCEAAKLYDSNRGDFFPLAYVIIKWEINHALDKCSRNQQPNLSLDQQVFEEDAVELGSLIPDPDDEFERIEYDILVESVCQKVGPAFTVKEREAFRLWLHGKNYAEISMAMKIGMSGVRTNIWRANKKCRTLFNPEEMFA